MRMERRPGWNASDPIRSVAAVTVIAELPEIEPLAAVTVPLPSNRLAVKIARPSSTVIEPMPAGVTRHVTGALVAFPNASVAVAANPRVPRARTCADEGVTARRASGPAAIVTVCVTVGTPGAEAVSVWLPASVSR
jgi:hypothetical protein